VKKKPGPEKKICDHQMVNMFLEGPQIRACFKCKKFWPKEHPKYSADEIARAIEHAIFVSAQAKKLGKRDIYDQVRDIDLL